MYEISDREAYTTMLTLWNAGIPATPSGGSYVAGALKLANSLNETSTIVTLVFDSLEYYHSLLSTWVPKITGQPIDMDAYQILRGQALKDRAYHIRTLKQRTIEPSFSPT